MYNTYIKFTQNQLNFFGAHITVSKKYITPNLKLYLIGFKLNSFIFNLDFINIMTYDYFTGGSKIAGHHANLYKSDKSNGKGNYSDLAVQQHLAAGIPKNKLVLGVPFYGRYWKGVEPKDQGLYQAATGPTGGLSYAQIADSLKAEVFEEYWDESAKAPYIWRAKDSLWITYDNKESLSQKVQFVNENQLRGIMFWQFNGDNGELLQNIKF